MIFIFSKNNRKLLKQKLFLRFTFLFIILIKIIKLFKIINKINIIKNLLPY